MEPGQADQACAQAATILIQAMNTTKDANTLSSLAWGLAAVTARMEKGHAAEACAQAAATLIQAMTTNKVPWLSLNLSVVAKQMEPAKAAEVCARAAAILIQDMTTTKDVRAWLQLSETLSAVAARMEPGRAAQACAQAAATLSQAMPTTTNAQALGQLPQGLSALLAGVDYWEQEGRAVALAKALGRAANGYGPLACLPLLQPALEPVPCRLSTQQLVELLKHPLFVNEARRVVLDHLGRRYGRRFADVWEFVAWAQEHEPNLDFTTPPQRPRP
jgi:hypothetical protein